jgi:hypothetical protein
MDVTAQIQQYIASQPDAKRADMETLHQHILELLPGGRLWYLDGTDETGKVVSNPNIGYGQYTITYANGKTRDFFQVGMSANQTGISIHIMGIADKTYLPQTFGKEIGKASVTGYCIKFKKLQDINLEVLEAAIRYGVSQH